MESPNDSLDQPAVSIENRCAVPDVLADYVIIRGAPTLVDALLHLESLSSSLSDAGDANLILEIVPMLRAIFGFKTVCELYLTQI